MPSRKRKKRKLKLSRGSILMTLAALWLTYRAVTAPGSLMQLMRFAPGPGEPVAQLLDQASGLQGKINDESAALEDLGRPDGISRLPATHTPTVAFSRLTPHCPSLKRLKSDTWIEIDEMGHILSVVPESKEAQLRLGNCEFEPYRDPNGRPLSVRTLYTVAR